MGSLRWRGEGEEGVTLVEVLITVLLLGVVVAIASPALLSGFNVVNQTDEDTRGLADIKLFVERMSRDLRAARKVYPTSTLKKLDIWIDYNSDYKASADENVTWALEAQGSGPLFNVVRSTDAGGSELASQTVINGMSFTYCAPPASAPACQTPPPEGTRFVQVNVEYDAEPGRDGSVKTAGFDIRLRNVQ